VPNFRSAVVLNGHKVTGLGNGSASGDLAAFGQLPTLVSLGAAPLASPAFTGTPTVPTAAALTANLQAASTAYADAVVAAEYARALLAEALAAATASPAFTGNPTAPTPAKDNNSTRLATTAYSDRAGSKRVLQLSAGSATPAINTDSYDIVHVTAQSAAITSFTSGLTGSPADGDNLYISITDNGTPQAIAWGTSFEAGLTALPGTTVASTRLDAFFVWNTETSKWRTAFASVAVASANQAVGSQTSSNGYSTGSFQYSSNTYGDGGGSTSTNGVVGVSAAGNGASSPGTSYTSTIVGHTHSNPSHSHGGGSGHTHNINHNHGYFGYAYGGNIAAAANALANDIATIYAKLNGMNVA
jgi:hypothetical protein